MDKDTLTARGHQIIADAMAKAKEAEQALHKNQAVSTHVEACLRDLWNLMMAPDETDAQRHAAEHQALTDGEAAAVAEAEALAAAPPTANSPDYVPADKRVVVPAPIPTPFDPPKSLEAALPPAASEPSTPHVPEAAGRNVAGRNVAGGGAPAELPDDPKDRLADLELQANRDAAERPGAQANLDAADGPVPLPIPPIPPLPPV